MYKISTEGKQELDLEHPLIKFHPKNKSEWWTIRNAFEGVQIFGGIGSGKSSGSGKTIAKAFLRNGFGGLVLCAKPDEKDEWIKYAKEMGRAADVVIFGEGRGFEFNPLQYEMSREGKGAGEVFNLTNLFMEIYKMGNRFTGGGGGGDSERYWDNALRRCINRSIQLLILAGETLSVENMRSVLVDALNEEEGDSYYRKTQEELGAWAESNYCVYCLAVARLNLIEEEGAEGYDEEVVYNFSLVESYFLREFAKLEEKTRMTVMESYLGLAEPFMSGILKKYFSGETTIFPEWSFEGKIIILDFSVKEYLQAGVYAQGIFKLLWQQAIERRNKDKYPLPAFLWVDESQNFVSEYDTIFQTTARSSRACTVFLTQNISNYYAQMGGESSRAKVNSLLGNLSTKVFHCNNDSVTNEWASKVIGNDLINLFARSEQRKRHSIMADSTTRSSSFQFLPQVFPMDFTTLATGGEYFNFLVEAIVVVKGKTWSTGNNYIEVEFSQIN